MATRSLWTQTYRLTIERPDRPAATPVAAASTPTIKPVAAAKPVPIAPAAPAKVAQPAARPAAQPAAAPGPKAPTKRLASRWLERYK